MQRYLALLLTFCLVLQIALPVALFAQTTETIARITANSLNVRSGPGTDFDVVDKVTRGQELIALRQESGWVQIELPSGATGWVAARYTELIQIAPSAPPDTPTTIETPPPPRPEETSTRSTSSSGGGGGGSTFGSLLKWSSLLGAGALGGLAFYERSQGNDTYDEYEQLVLDGLDDEAEVKWTETSDHDDKAQIYGIAAGSLFGLFLLQQFVFGRGSSSYDVTRRDAPPIQWNPGTNEFRATVTLARF